MFYLLSLVLNNLITEITNFTCLVQLNNFTCWLICAYKLVSMTHLTCKHDIVSSITAGYGRVYVDPGQGWPGYCQRDTPQITHWKVKVMSKSILKISYIFINKLNFGCFYKLPDVYIRTMEQSWSKHPCAVLWSLRFALGLETFPGNAISGGYFQVNLKVWMALSK